MKEKIQEYSSDLKRNKSEIEKIVITLRKEDNKILDKKDLKHYNFSITDMPGLDDTAEQNNIRDFIKSEVFSIVPIFLFDMVTGTTKLEHFDCLRNLFGKTPVIVIFTKFKGSLLAFKTLKDGEENIVNLEEEIL